MSTKTSLKQSCSQTREKFLGYGSCKSLPKRGTNSEQTQSFPPHHHHHLSPPQEKRQNRGEESHLTHRTRLKDKRSVEMCAKLSFCPLLRLSTRLWVQRTCQTSKTAKSLPWFGLFFPPLKLFLPDKSKGVYLEESEGEQGMWNSAQR